MTALILLVMWLVGRIPVCAKAEENNA